MKLLGVELKIGGIYVFTSKPYNVPFFEEARIHLMTGCLTNFWGTEHLLVDVIVNGQNEVRKIAIADIGKIDTTDLIDVKLNLDAATFHHLAMIAANQDITIDEAMLYVLEHAARAGPYARRTEASTHNQPTSTEE